MAGEQRIVWFPLGFAAATGILLALLPLPAAGQILDAPQRAELPPRRVQAAPASPWATAVRTEDENPFHDGRFGPDVPAPATLRGTVEELATQETAAEDLEADELGEAQGRPRRLAVPQDGDPVSVLEPPAPADGNLGEEEMLADEEDPTRVDLRSPEDIAAFDGAAPGFDPLLLQAEEVNPVLSDRQVRQFEPHPFAPLGTRLGSFILFTNVEADGDYNSNVFDSPEPQEDAALEVRPAARFASDWSMHALELRASGELSYHKRFQSEDDRAYLVEGLGRIDVTRRTNVQALFAHELAQESRSAINASSAGTRPDIVVNRGRLALNHRFNRLSVQLRGGVTDTRYGSDFLDGEMQSNEDRDFTLYEEAVRPKWEFTPTLFLFSDIAVNRRHYGIAAFTDGINRSSTGERYRVGLSFGNTGEYLRGEASLGYGRQQPDAPELEVIDGILVDANLTWRVTRLTTLLFTAASEVAETTTVDSGGVMERQYAVEARHSFLTRLIGSAGIGYLTRDFVGGNLNENQFTAAAGLEYFLSREAVLFGRYEHTAFDTTSPNGNYTVEEVQLGVRLRH